MPSRGAAAPAPPRYRRDSRRVRPRPTSLAVGVDQRDVDAVVARSRSSARWPIPMTWAVLVIRRRTCYRTLNRHARRSSCRAISTSPEQRFTPECLVVCLTEVTTGQRQGLPMSTYKSDFLNVLASRGFIHQISEPDALDALRAELHDHRLYRLRLHRALAACRLAAADHDAALAAADRPPADRADGRRHHARRRSLRQGREPQAPDRRDDRRKSHGHPRGVREIPEVRRRPRRRRDGQQRRLAQHAQLHRLPARRRPAFLGQPHAVLRLGEAAARAPAGAVVPRIQLHDPAGLRFRRAATSATAACCRWAAPTSGATSSTASISAAACSTRSCSR